MLCDLLTLFLHFKLCLGSFDFKTALPIPLVLLGQGEASCLDLSVQLPLAPPYLRHFFVCRLRSWWSLGGRGAGSVKSPLLSKEAELKPGAGVLSLGRKTTLTERSLSGPFGASEGFPGAWCSLPVLASAPREDFF